MPMAHWQKIPNFIFADVATLPAPSLSDFDWIDPEPIALAVSFVRPNRPLHGAPPPQDAPWPRPSEFQLENAANLPAPAQSVFEMPEGLDVALHNVASPHHAERARSSVHEARAKLTSSEPGDSRRLTRGKVRLGHGHAHHSRRGSSTVAGRGTPPVATAHRAPPKHMVQVKKRNV